MNNINTNFNISKNNNHIKPKKNKNNFNKSSKLRKNELKSKISINHTDKLSFHNNKYESNKSAIIFTI